MVYEPLGGRKNKLIATFGLFGVNLFIHFWTTWLILGGLGGKEMEKMD